MRAHENGGVSGFAGDGEVGGGPVSFYDGPVAGHWDLAKAFLSGMERLGEAVELACRKLDPTFRRVNLEILGNTEAILHAYVWPRYEWELKDLIGKPVWLYPPESWTSEEFALAPRHDQLRKTIADKLDELSNPTADA